MISTEEMDAVRQIMMEDKGFGILCRHLPTPKDPAFIN